MLDIVYCASLYMPRVVLRVVYGDRCMSCDVRRVSRGVCCVSHDM